MDQYIKHYKPKTHTRVIKVIGMIQNFNTMLLKMVRDNVFGTDSDTRFCPVCGHLGSFDAAGSRKNAICPDCGSNDRARLYYMYLMSMGLGKEKTKVLHIVPETSVRYKINHMENIEYLPAGVKDIPDVMGKSRKYDLIMANYILDRVEDPAAFLEMVKKCLSKNGTAMLSVHINDKEDLSVTPRKYSENVVSVIKEAGLDAELIPASRMCGAPLAVLCGIPENESILIIRK